MAVDTATGVLSLTSGGSVGSTFSVTGLSFQPKALIVWWTGRSDATDAIGAQTLLENRQGFGFATGASNRFCVGFAFGRKTARNDALVATVSNVTVSDGRIDLQSFNSDGFTLVIDDALPVALRLSWLALGGSDLTNVKADSFSYTTGTGNLDISGVGFQPDALFCIQPNATSAETFTTDMHFGFAGGATPDNITWSAYGSGVAYCKSGECFSVCESIGTGVVGRGAISLWQSDGFRINRISDLGATRTAYYLALKGGKYKVGSFATRTDGNDITVTPSFLAKAAFAISAGRAESTAATSTSNGEVSAGVFTSTSSRNCQGAFHDSTDTQTIIEYDEFYANIDTTPAILGLGDVTAIGSTTYTVVMDDPDNAANFVGYIAIGDPSVTTVTVNQAAESDLSQALTHLKTKAVAQAAETDLSQAIAHNKVKAVAQAFEIDTAQPLGTTRIITVNQAFELDTAFALAQSAPKIILLRQAKEIDLAQTIFTIPEIPSRPVFTDSTIIFNVSVPTTVVTGLDHLEGREVCVVADGIITETHYTVSGNQITLASPALQKIEVGLCYDGELWTMRPGIKESVVEGLPRLWSKLGFTIDDSYGGLIKIGNSASEAPLRTGDHSYPTQPGFFNYTRLFSGEVDVVGYGESELDGRVKVRVPTPGPFTLLAICGDIEFGDHA